MRSWVQIPVAAGLFFLFLVFQLCVLKRSLKDFPYKKWIPSFDAWGKTGSNKLRLGFEKVILLCCWFTERHSNTFSLCLSLRKFYLFTLGLINLCPIFRCFPYLQRALEQPGCNLAKAKVALLICQRQPEKVCIFHLQHLDCHPKSS